MEVQEVTNAVWLIALTCAVLAMWLMLERIIGLFFRRQFVREPHKFIVAYDRDRFGSGQRDKMMACFNSWNDVAVLLIAAQSLDEPFRIYRLDMAPSIEEIKTVIEERVTKASEMVH